MKISKFFILYFLAILKVNYFLKKDVIFFQMEHLVIYVFIKFYYLRHSK